MKIIKNKLYKLLLNNQLLGVILLLITLLIILFSQQNIVVKVQENDNKIKESFYLEHNPKMAREIGKKLTQIELKVEAETVKQEQIKQKSNTESEVMIPKIIYETWELTAYTSGYESTGKNMNHPAYRITASGEEVKANHTIACPRTLPFGTKIYIPYFDNTFVCKDRGQAIKGKRLDVYMDNLEDALQFGRRKLEIKIIKG